MLATFKFAGSVSHGTLRTSDLLPAFVSLLSDVLEDATFRPGADSPDVVARMAETQSILGALEGEITRQHDAGMLEEWAESEGASWDLEWLFDALEEWAPEGYTFGAHEGDGSDFGFWLVDEA